MNDTSSERLNTRMNSSEEFELTIDMKFNEGHMISIITYSVLMGISAIGNISVLLLIMRRRRTTKSRIYTMLMHLAIADLLVTFLMMPLEIGWSITVSWKAGDAMCRIMAFFRVFGLYLSSFILVCISMDRYYAVIKPLQLLHVDRRGKIMLTIAWLGSIFCSIPQMMVFHLETHPNITWYSQCITFNAFPTYTHELTYSLFGMVMMYWFPLTIIIFTYTSILLEICKRSKESVEDRIRRSSLVFLSRARIRTLKMTIIIVAVFFICWTPYYVMSLWYWIDKTSARKVDQRVQKGLFLFACTNSCMNPIVYGVFNIRDKKKGTTSLTNNPAKGRGISHEQSKDNCIPNTKDRVVDLQLKTITARYLCKFESRKDHRTLKKI
ncbi:PREDICTED: gonadotropin-releasing hormone II receptor-like isoform X1 [Polistes canadensis]|uniref:gonadotropin-releasing hormone II receptor-like isoform X1 n=1 Tax=Polistes canadensis TaxID=91411 RepID=UPI000718B166|nr:PREDICTED: gonadotropin-releasing hormone II receptor-like isoform X1 [Polistes canadensis]XP_014614730.1 PREDICTED: gonadotropin-releasing hormone II receptor-like isoform X1 [Polistes canadensis]XP_014614732.1 PREDICTED: gonadotropin-releasing hormone II receptor-like isoform X1 [Polistes canadensis]